MDSYFIQLYLITLIFNEFNELYFITIIIYFDV